MTDTICRFEQDMRFLSNFYPCPITVTFIETGEIVTFRSAEAAFQAAKCPEVAQDFENLAPDKAKHLGRAITLRPDWEDVKDDIMYKVVLGKFTQNEDLARRLIETGEAMLIEGNDWGDTYWGQVNGVGENRLGRILMRVREELQTNS